MSFDGVAVSDKLPATRAELKMGAEVRLSPNLTVWGYGAIQTARGYTQSSINAGLKYGW
jgi:outer membrane autotransporter protein